MARYNTGNRAIRVHKKAAPDRERRAADPNVHAPRGVGVAEKRRLTHIQDSSPLSLQKTKLGRSQVGKRRAIRESSAPPVRRR